MGLAALALVLLPSCSSGSSHETAAGSTVRVQERDFRITISPSRVSAGTVRLLVHNQGPDSHELLVVRSSRGSLPLRSDGLTINEAKIDRSTVKVMEGQDAGDAQELLLHLKPGRYELFCNMAGHFLGGMHTELVVT